MCSADFCHLLFSSVFMTSNLTDQKKKKQPINLVYFQWQRSQLPILPGVLMLENKYAYTCSYWCRNSIRSSKMLKAALLCLLLSLGAYWTQHVSLTTAFAPPPLSFWLSHCLCGWKYGNNKYANAVKYSQSEIRKQWTCSADRAPLFSGCVWQIVFKQNVIIFDKWCTQEMADEMIELSCACM